MMQDGRAEKIKLLAVVGPTAGGKSKLAAAVAKLLNGEVISCDSMQIYRDMNIGTAKPTLEEMDGVPHHLIDFADPHKTFSGAEYVELAQKTVAEIAERGKIPVFCGGTGLYLDAFLRGGFEETQSDPALRQSLLDYAQQNGAHALHQRLEQVDPESAAAIHENNVRRVARALEIFETTGMTKTEADRKNRMAESPYEAAVVGLRYESRELLYRRIDLRVDLMLEAGLLEETKKLRKEGVFETNATAAQAIGYKELLGFLDGRESYESAVESLKRATRRYAKRQMTWFGAKDYVTWINADENGNMRPFESVLQDALAIFEN